MNSVQAQTNITHLCFTWVNCVRVQHVWLSGQNSQQHRPTQPHKMFEKHMLSHHHEYLIEYVSHLPFSLSLLPLQRSNCNLNTVTYLVALQVTELMTPQRKSVILILMLRKKKNLFTKFTQLSGGRDFLWRSSMNWPIRKGFMRCVQSLSSVLTIRALVSQQQVMVWWWQRHCGLYSWCWTWNCWNGSKWLSWLSDQWWAL